MSVLHSPISLEKAIRFCIPAELIPSDWSCTEIDPLSNIQSLLEKSFKKTALRLFGNGFEILCHILKSTHFPGSRDFLDLPVTQGFTRSQNHYNSLKGQRFIYKHEWLNALQFNYQEQKCSLDPLGRQLADSLISLHLRRIERKLTKNNEMVPFADEHTLEFYTLLNQLTMKGDQGYQDNLADLAQFDDWKQMFRIHNDPQILEVVEGFYSKVPMEDHRFFIRVFTFTYQFVQAFNIFIENHPEFFKANKDLPSNQRTLTVRLFKVGQIDYLMAHELLEVMKIGEMDVSKVEDQLKNLRKLGTFNLRQAFGILGKDMARVQFITVPINVHDQATALIPSFNGEGFCLPATDVFMKTLTNVFIMKKVGLRFDRRHIQKFFEIIADQYFDPANDQGVYFISYEDVQRIGELIESHFSEEKSTILEIPKTTPFDEKLLFENLRTEKDYLRFMNLLDRIAIDADKKYENAFKSQQFPLDGIFSSIKACHLQWVLRKFPKFIQFLHNQKACSNFICLICNDPVEFVDLLKLSEDDSEVVEAEAKPVIEKKKKKKRGKKTSVRKAGNEEHEATIVPEVTPIASTSGDGSEEEPESPLENSESSTIVTSEEDSTKSVTTQKKKNSKKTPFLEKQNKNKESQNCQKCFRTSELCQKAQEDCKISNNKNKKLESQLKSAERKLEEAENGKKETELKLERAEEKLMESENRQLKMKEEFEKMMEQMKKAQEENEMLKRLLAAKTQPEEEELGDLECLICHDDMDDIKDTLKCQNCCRRYHKDCLVGWFEKSRSCPVCDSEFEDGIEN